MTALATPAPSAATATGRTHTGLRGADAEMATGRAAAGTATTGGAPNSICASVVRPNRTSTNVLIS